MKFLMLLSFLTLASFTAVSQNSDCKVLSDSLKGNYEGDCKNGKADGRGKAIGTDSYDGEFRNGLPDGKGIYSWKNGNSYDGQWKKGMKDGKGELKTIENGQLTTKNGYWKKDKYVGLYENPYKIITATSQIGRVEVNNMDKKGNSVIITVNNTARAHVTMTDFQISRGSYERKSNSSMSSADITTFSDVVFPFAATFYFGSAILQIEIYEKGAWDIAVPIL